MNIKKGDNVIVISGRDKGKQGIVEVSMPSTEKLVIAGINIRTRHLKPSKTQPKGGLVQSARPFNRANVMLVCPHCSKPSRISVAVAEDGTKYRRCIHCQTSVDTK